MTSALAPSLPGPHWTMRSHNLSFFLFLPLYDFVLCTTLCTTDDPALGHAHRLFAMYYFVASHRICLPHVECILDEAFLGGRGWEYGSAGAEMATGQGDWRHSCH